GGVAAVCCTACGGHGCTPGATVAEIDYSLPGVPPRAPPAPPAPLAPVRLWSLKSIAGDHNHTPAGRWVGGSVGRRAGGGGDGPAGGSVGRRAGGWVSPLCARPASRSPGPPRSGRSPDR